MKRIVIALAVVTAVAAPAVGFAGCSDSPSNPDLGPSTFHIEIDSVNGSGALPTEAKPLPANHGDKPEAWAFKIEARTPTGEIATDFNGYVRLSLQPGTVAAVTGPGAQGRNIKLTNGTVSGVVMGTAVYGPARLWVEDLGYTPAATNSTPACSNGVDDNGNGLVDFPADPGCYFADDDDENGGTYAAGVSPPVYYALPLISDVRGGASTPYPNEAVQIATGCPTDITTCAFDAPSDPEYVVVTRVSNNGFFVTDVGANAVAKGYNSLFAFNFSTPAGLRVCDRVTYLSGTATDFFGFTQLSFPSFQNVFVILGTDGGFVDPDAGVPGCRVPEPKVLDPTLFAGSKDVISKNLYPYEAGLVRLEGFTVAKNFGPGLAHKNNFGPNTSNCDFNNDGQIDFTQVNCMGGADCEGDCATVCDSLADCSEWTSFSARSEFKVSHGSAMVKVNASTVGSFNPVASAGAVIPHITGTLTEFSGGSLNWTVEVRCSDDLVCPMALGCTVNDKPIISSAACVRPRTIDDNDQGTD